MKSRLFIFLGFLLTLSSCLKKIDGPIEVPTQSLPSTEVALGGDYINKSYYNLATNSIVKTSSALTWDIAFCTTSEKELVIINYALGPACSGFTLNSSDFSKIVTENDFNKNTLKYANFYDDFADLFSANFINGSTQKIVYYLLFGPKGFKKLQITDYKPNQTITIHYSSLDGSNEQTQVISLASNTNYVYYSLFDNKIIDVEPDNKADWDIEVTRYTTLVTAFGSTRMYAVGGFLFNPSKSLSAGFIENKDLINATIEDIAKIQLSSDYQAVGYDWKEFSSQSTSGYYTIYPRSYYIQNQEKYYGIQFTNYTKQVDNQFVNGYPTFLYKKLN